MFFNSYYLTTTTISFLDQISFDFNKRTNIYAKRVNTQFTKSTNIYVFYNISKSNKYVNDCVVYIVIQILVFKDSLFNIILFANNRDSFDIQVLFTNNNNIKIEFKSNYLRRK